MIVTRELANLLQLPAELNGAILHLVEWEAIEGQASYFSSDSTYDRMLSI